MAATTRRPRLPDALAVGLTVLAQVGIWHPITQATLPLGARFALSGLALLMAGRALRRPCTSIVLDDDGTLSIVDRVRGAQADRVQIERGVITSGGYRSASLLVLHVRTADGRQRCVDVWRDAVSAEQFSALHLALAHAQAGDSPPSGIRPAQCAALHSPATATEGACRTKETDRP